MVSTPPPTRAWERGHSSAQLCTALTRVAVTEGEVLSPAGNREGVVEDVEPCGGIHVAGESPQGMAGRTGEAVVSPNNLQERTAKAATLPNYCEIEFKNKINVHNLYTDYLIILELQELQCIILL